MDHVRDQMEEKKITKTDTTCFYLAKSDLHSLFRGYIGLQSEILSVLKESAMAILEGGEYLVKEGGSGDEMKKIAVSTLLFGLTAIFPSLEPYFSELLSAFFKGSLTIFRCLN